MKFDELKKASPEEFKTITLGILKRIHEVCIQHNIRYAITAGTLLGAIRHKGFIPWDDDIDIMMPAEDYKLFCKVFPSADGQYYILDSSKSQYYYNNFSRACDKRMILKMKGVSDIENFGAFVDVFLLYKWPDGSGEKLRYAKNPDDADLERLQYRDELKKAYKRIQYALPERILKTHRKKRVLKTHIFFWNILKYRYIKGIKKCKDERDGLLVKYQNSEYKWRSISADSLILFRGLWFMNEEDMDKRILVQFEDLIVYAPENYDHLLKVMFNDYMKLPPENERVSHHHFTPYWRQML